MFTGIITEVGRLRVRKRAAGADERLEITAPKTVDALAIGASVACNGICLTAVEVEEDHFSVDVSLATLACTTCGDWRIGEPVNLERALRVGDELSGHLVFGHVDGVGVVESVDPVEGSHCTIFKADPVLLPYIAAKGSITVDGVSLTVNRVGHEQFAVNIVPHTRRETSFAELELGDQVNIEVDMLARYVARLREVEAS